MRLFTFSSSAKNHATLGHSLAFLAAIFAVLLAVEFFTRWVVPSASRIEARVAREHRAARSMQMGTPLQAVLIVGNSLLDAGVHFDELQRSLLPGVEARRFVVEDTSYTDWFFGLRRLIREGTRPHRVVVMLTANQLVSEGFRGSYSAYRLLQPDDVPAVARSLRLSNTATFGLLVSNISAYYGLRSELRKQFLKALVPELPLLTARLIEPRKFHMEANQAVTLAARRLSDLKLIAQGARIELVFVIPPTTEGDAVTMTNAVRIAGGIAGVPVVVPIHPTELGAEFYTDGFHLNDRGAKVFTSRLIRVLQTNIAP